MRHFVRLGTGILGYGLVALLAMTPSGAEGGVDPSPFKFGMVGLASGQTLRLNVANVADPANPRSPTCMVEVMFRKSDGMMVRASYLFSVEPGKAAFEDLSAGDVGISGAPTRVQIRGILMVERMPAACKHLVLPSLEIFDDATGKTMVLLPPEPIQHPLAE